MSKTQIKVASIDDHSLLRGALATLINSFENYRIVMEADNGHDFIEKLYDMPREDMPDIVMMDITMPKMNGLDTTKWLQANFPDIKIVILSMMDVTAIIIDAIKAGAHGYLSKDSKPMDLRKALDEISMNGIYYPDVYKDLIIDSLRNSSRGTAEKNKYAEIWGALNKQEQVFIRLSASDLTYVQIARQMKTTTSIVEGMRQSMFTRFNVKTRVGLALMAQKYNFLDTP